MMVVQLLVCVRCDAWGEWMYVSGGESLCEDCFKELKKKEKEVEKVVESVKQ